MDYQSDEYRVHLIVYHLVWCPKRRKAVLGVSIAQDCQSPIEQKCAKKGWEILEPAIQADHIHLCARVWPTDSATDVVKEIQRLTVHHLRKKYAVLRRLPSLRTRSYCASTAGNVSQEILQCYIAAQKGL
jgi:putative transposase